ncbi:ribonuclease H-like domain-containing protein [Mycena rosella]|uniref:ribonuclease H n=1 Tax=Mycena rosella TaxID=1033263 RepID=A0AAD7DQD1_MYCRO|nr:ribonuclease H-like domain-containing protein [Mycena rosella]
MEYHRDPKISERLFRFCPRFDDLTTTERIDCCDTCDRFFARCCHHEEIVCHFHAFVFVDGACPGNRRPGARAGIGCALGTRAEDQLAITVTEAMDPGAPRTSQRAELLAALEGLHFLVGAERKYHVGSRAHLKSKDPEREFIVVTDSEYVVKGMTEWMPYNNWRTQQGRVPANLDLFQRLDAAVAQYESQGIKIQFFHVRRELNSIADGLAKRAAAESSIAF